MKARKRFRWETHGKHKLKDYHYGGKGGEGRSEKPVEPNLLLINSRPSRFDKSYVGLESEHILFICIYSTWFTFMNNSTITISTIVYRDR